MTLSQDLSENGFSTGRVIVVALPLLVLGALMAQVVEVYRMAGGITGGIPASGAMGLFVPLLLLCTAVPALRRRWDVTRGELIVVFSMLVLAMPIYGPALWHHLLPLQIENHRHRDLDRAMSMSPKLWPNQGDLLEAASVEDEPGRQGITWTFPHTTASRCDTPNGPGRSLQIVHESDTDISDVLLVLDKSRAPRYVRPLLRYAIWARLRLDDPSVSASAALWAGIGPQEGFELASIRSATKPGVLAPDRFQIIGRIDYEVPYNLDERFMVRLRFKGKGTLWARDFQIVDTEDVYRYLEGYEHASAKVYDTLAPPERGLTRLRAIDGSLLERTKYLHFGMAPWVAWSKPLFAWGLLIAALYLAMFSLVTLFFRQWEQRDRLTFPLQNFILDLTSGDAKGRLSILRVTPFWIGFIACAMHLSLRMAHRYVPDLPYIQTNFELEALLPPGTLREAISAGPYFGKLTIDIRPLYVAVAFFMSLEISMSMLVFFMVNCGYRFTCFFTPLKTLKAAGVYREYGFPFQHLWAAGGILFMTFFCVFAARKHLIAVAAKVFLGRATVDDSKEAMSYRWALLSLVLAVVIFIWFGNYAGINPVFVVVYLTVFLLIALSAARIRAETGLPHGGIMITHPQWIFVGLGTAMAFGFREVTLTAQLFFLSGGTFLMTAPIIGESMAACSRVGVPLTKLGRCLAIGFVVAITVGGIVSMSWAYTVGALNLNRSIAQKRGSYNPVTAFVEGDDKMIEQHFRDHPDEEPIVTPEVADRIGGPQAVTLGIVGTSFGITGLLSLARIIWLGFPLHPLGFALAFTSAMNSMWSSIAVAYIIKSLGLRFGGVQMVRRTLRPFFVGLFVAELLMAMVWGIIDALTKFAVMA